MADFYNRLGSTVASFQNARRLLEMGEVVGIFPEGVEGVAKGIGQRYRVQPFRTGFTRLSLMLRVPIIPAAVVGAEEIYPIIGKWTPPAAVKNLLSIPYLPLTPLFPWLGPFGMIPLPTRWRIRFGAPLRLYDTRSAVAPTRQRIAAMSERVRRRVQAMVHELLARRESIF